MLSLKQAIFINIANFIKPKIQDFSFNMTLDMMNEMLQYYIDSTLTLDSAIQQYR